MPAPLKCKSIRPVGTFCSVKWPLLSTVDVDEAPVIVTVSPPARVVHRDAVLMPRTVPEIVVPVDRPPDVGAVGAALDGPVGDAGPWLPQAPARTPNERTNEMVIARTVFSSKCVVFTANVHGRDVKAHGTSPRTIAGKLNAIWSMH